MIRKIVFILFFTLFFKAPIQACECIFNPQETFHEFVSKYPLIFYAEVISVEDSKNPFFEEFFLSNSDTLYGKSFGYEPRFRIIEIIKGEFFPNLSDDSFTLKSDNSLCSASFRNGEKYLIYSYSMDPNKIHLTICNPGRTFLSQKEFKKYKKKIKEALRQKPS